MILGLYLLCLGALFPVIVARQEYLWQILARRGLFAMNLLNSWKYLFIGPRRIQDEFHKVSHPVIIRWACLLMLIASCHRPKALPSRSSPPIIDMSLCPPRSTSRSWIRHRTPSSLYKLHRDMLVTLFSSMPSPYSDFCLDVAASIHYAWVQLV